ncbi:MAG: ATP-binding protein [Spirochaetes bacterium]|jgi:signal transduction histidine kinase|nr:ATP-binding protein [Spirochaetota bacterium]
MKQLSNNTGSNTVLIIEDDLSQLKTLADILETEGFHPVCCKSDKEAYDAIEKQEMNVAILDLRLGEVDGISVLKKLKKHDPEIKVIINTAYASLESAVNAVNEEAFAYITKMDDIENLLSHVHRAFREHLVRYTRILENEVEKRTRDLTVANKKLKKEIEEHKKTESALEDRTKELARSNAELEEFAYIASHDIQEPLHTIQAFCDLILTKYSHGLKDKALDYLARIQKASERMHNLIENILILSSVRKKKISYVTTDINKIIKEIIIDHQPTIDKLDAVLTIEKLPAIEADPIQIQQLFSNLICNALKFHSTGKRPEINIYSEETGAGKNSKTNPKDSKDKTEEACRIIVKDNGIGFSKKNANRIFQPFERLHGHSSYEGTGIGLAICQSIVQRHRGTITADSVPGEGSAFTITLPFHHK